MNSSLKDLIILLGIGAAIFLGGYFAVKEFGKSDFEISGKVSLEQEEKLGNLFSDLLLQQYNTLEDNYADSAVQQIAHRLLDGLDSTRYRYRFVLLKNEQVNAFTIPGGNIFIFTGLIKITATPEELAAVLAHEIGHTENRHVVSKLVKEMSLTALISVLSGNDPSLITQLLKEIAGNSFDRRQEAEADDFALKLLEKAKISPKNLARFFESLNAKDMDYDKNLEILMTHPHNDSRIANARKYKTKNDFKPEPIDLEWEKVKSSIE